MGTIWRSLTLATLAISSLTVGGAAANAQTASDGDRTDAELASPAYAVRLEGEAQLLRDGQVDEFAPGLPLEEGDQLNTGLGRLEWRRDGAESVFLDRHSAAVLNGQHLTRLDAGTMVLTLPVEDGAVAYRVDTPAASVRLSWPGRYRLEVRPGTDGATTITTLRGRALVQTVDGDLTVRAGERAFVLPREAPEPLADVNVAVLDAFDRWVEASPMTERGEVDAEQLPRVLSGYGPVLARYGVWRTDVTYGRVWYPNVVPDWRPYAIGRWHRARRFGYVWMGADPWSWPTHHYGRWQMTVGGRWFWIPAARWSAAHVYWAVAPGYVAWAPLGWNGRPLVDFRVGLDYYSSGGFGAGGAFISRGGYDPWNVWTVMPAASLGHRRAVADLRLHRTHFHPADRVSFVMTPRLPLSRGRVTDSPAHVGRAIPRDRPPAGLLDRPRAQRAPPDRMRAPRPRDAEPRAFGAPRGDNDPYARAERARRQHWPGDVSAATPSGVERREPHAPPTASRPRPMPRADGPATGPFAPRQPRETRAADENQPRRMGPSARPSAPRGGFADEPAPDTPQPAGVRPRAPFGRSAAPSGDARPHGGGSPAHDRGASPPSGEAGQAVPRGEGARRSRN
jgi:hypothetical protein